MSAHFVLATARKDLRRRFTDPIGVLIWFALPIAVGGLLVLVNGGDDGTPRGRLLIADEDASFVSGLIGTLPSRGGLGELFDVEPVTREEGRHIVEAGEASALLILPAGLQDAFAGKGNAEIRLVTHPAQRILPAVIEESAEIVVDSAFYVSRLLGGGDAGSRGFPPRAAAATGTPLSVEAAGELLARLDSLLQETGNLALVPPALGLRLAPRPEAGNHEESTGLVPMGRVFLPGIVFLCVLFVAQGLSGDVWNEKRLGTLRRAVSAPFSMSAFLAGKLLAGALIAGLAAVVGVGTGVLFLDLPLRQAPLALLWIAFSGATMLTAFMLLQLFASSQRAGDMLSNLVMFPAMMLGGSFFPFAMMPEWMAAIGRWTPNGAALARLDEILNAGPDYPALSGTALLLGVAAALAFTLSVRRLRGRFLVS